MRHTTDTRRYRRTVPGVMAALLLVAGVATAGCGSEESSTALPAPGSDAEVNGTIKATGTTRGGARPSTTKSSSRTATTSRGAGNVPISTDPGGAPSMGGAGVTQGSGGPGAANPSVTNGGPKTTGPGTTRPTTKATGGQTKPSDGDTARTGGGRPYPGPNADPSDTVVISGQTPVAGPVITPGELLARFDPLYAALPAKSPEVMRQTEDVVRLTREAPPESQRAASGDAAILVAAAEEVSRTGNVAKYEEPQVRAAYQNLKAEQARVPAGVDAGRVDAR